MPETDFFFERNLQEHWVCAQSLLRLNEGFEEFDLKFVGSDDVSRRERERERKRERKRERRTDRQRQKERLSAGL